MLGVLTLAAGLGFWLFAERWRLLRPSTVAGLRAGGIRSLLNLNALHMYIYARWTNEYLSILLNRIYPRLDANGWTWWRERYHAKVLTPEHAAAIVMLDRDVDLRNQEQIVPYPWRVTSSYTDRPIQRLTSAGAGTHVRIIASRPRFAWSWGIPASISCWSTTRGAAVG